MLLIFACMSPDKIVKYIEVELKLNANSEAHVQGQHDSGHRGHGEDRNHREVKGDTAGSAEDGAGSGQDHWTRDEQEKVHFFAVVAHNMKEH